MPCRCLVWNCTSLGNIPGITYHSLGKAHYVHWLRAIGRSPQENLDPKNVICSKHFCETDFVFVKGKKAVKHDAIPTLDLPPNVAFRNIQCHNLEPPAKKIKT